MSTTEAVWLIYSNEHKSWWRPNSCGYTTDKAQAGRYTKTEADDICGSTGYRTKGDRSQPPEVAVREDDMLSPDLDPLTAERLHADNLAVALQAYVDALYDGPANLGGLTCDDLERDAIALLQAHKSRRATSP